MTIKQFLRRPAVLAKTGFSATTLYNLEKAGGFPRHFMLTPRCAAWDAEQVDEWMRRRQSEGATVTVAGPDHTLRKRLPGRGKRSTSGVAA